MDLFQAWLSSIEALGPWGPLLFVATVMVAEMVPFFPSQPLSLAGGILFGAKKGALLMLIGFCLAAFNAFSISRGFGSKAVDKIIGAELGEDNGPVRKQLVGVQHAIENGGLWSQMAAVILLRLTPVVPFSASNYLLGLTPLSLPALFGGTVVGMTGWALIYASIGSASRDMLDKGTSLEELLAATADKASQYTNVIAWAGLAAGLAAAGYYAYTKQQGDSSAGDEGVISDKALQAKRHKEEVFQNK